jgi:succinate dehydrogenase / fumarate reductase membrane anchor subunit
LGLQVVIEDYVHAEGVKLVLLLAVKGAAWLFGGIAAFSVLKIAFGG